MASNRRLDIPKNVGGPLRGRLLKRPWPVRLVLVAALLLAVPLLFHAGSPVHAADNEITGVTLTSPNPGELGITWGAPSRAPSDYRLTWKKSDGKWPSYKNDNTVDGGNAFPTGTSHTVTDLEEGAVYKVRVRARYYDSNDKLTESGPWSDPPVELTIAALPDKPTGLSTDPSHDSIVLSWTDPADDTITSYQVLRGPDTDNLAVLVDDTGSSSPSYTDSTVAAETTYAYAIKGRNADGLSPQSEPVTVTTPTAPALPAKPTGITYGASHNNFLMFWTDPDDDTITGYQVLRGPDADSLAVLTEDTGTTDSNYSDDTVEAETTYAYAIRARNAAGLGPQSDTVSVTTQAAPEELLTELALAGVEFIIAGQTLDTTGMCSETDITQIAAGCTEDITNPMPQFGVVGTLDSDDEVTVRIGRTFTGSTEVADESDLQGPNKRINPTFQPGRNLLRVWGDEDGSGSTAAEQHFFRINVVPYWELNGVRLSKDDDCQSTTARTAAQITDSDCILTTLDPAVFRFYNVISDHFNAYVDLNTVRQVDAPDDTALGKPFTVDLDDGENVVRVRLAAKGGQPHGEVYDNNAFYYKVTGTDVLVSNIGQTDRDTGNFINQTTWRAQQFTTGTNPDGYKISEVVVNFESGVTGTFNFSIHQTDESGTVDVPGAKVVDLTGSPTTTGEHGFTPSNTTTLAPSTKYFVVFSKGTTGATALETTNSDNVDAVSARNWDMADKTLSSSDSGSTWTEHDYAIEIAIKGALFTLSTDATLSNLELRDSTTATASVVSLNPAFDSEVTEYTAAVANDKSSADLEVTTTDDNATVEFLDENDATIPTAGTSPGNIHFIEPNLDEGENVFKIKVTAEDTTTTKTYQVTVTRVDFLVSNIGQESLTMRIHPDNEVATQFTTGDNTTGYTLKKVRLPISVPTGLTPQLSIYSDVAGSLGVSVKTLTNPADILVDDDQIANMLLTADADFDADNFKLSANTSYWVVVRNSHASKFLVFQSTLSASEDAGSAPGWSIRNVSKAASIGSTLIDITSGQLMEIAIVAEPVSSDATLSSLVLTDSTFSPPSTVALNPAFDSLVTEYTAKLTNEQSNPGLLVTTTNNNATVEFLDEKDATIATTDIQTPNIHFLDSNVDVGDNIFKIKVTAEDTTTIKTYQVTITRAAAAPDAPAPLTASPGNAEATLTWTAPASDGGAAITKYQYRVSADGGSTWSPDWTDVPDADSDSDQADERTVTVTGLANGTLHTFQVRAVNSEGGGIEAQDTATPVAFLVSNANSIVNQGTLGTGSSNQPSNKRAIQFTTGDNPGGYKLDTVQLTVTETNGGVPLFSIYSDSSGVPGSSLKILTNPGTLPTSYALADFDAGQYPLKPNTSYWIVLEKASTTGQVFYRTTESTAEDPGTATGWSIGNHLIELNSGTWSDSPGARFIPQLTIKGEPVMKPDLVVDTPTVSDNSPGTGASFTLNATVRNQGTEAAPATTLRYYRSSDATITTSDTPEGTDSVAGLAAAATSAQSTSITAPSTAGTYYYGACVDAVSGESDTANNCSPSVTVTVRDVTPPTLEKAVASDNSLKLTYNEPLDSGSTPAAGRFTVRVNGNTRAVTNVSIAGSVVALTLSSSVASGDTITVSYSVPGTNPIQDVAGNDAGGLTSRAVTVDDLGLLLLSQPGISAPRCEHSGISLYWHTNNEGNAPAPDGWIVERRHDVGGSWSTRTWQFIGSDADALQTTDSGSWDWLDHTTSRNVSYTYRVRAINSDGSYMSGREWSRRAPVRCE